MSLPQAKFRELVFLLLYRHQFVDTAEVEEINFYMSTLKTTKQNVNRAKSYVSLIREKQLKLDESIGEVSVGYDLDRIQSIELNILRLALYEILFDDTIPEKVSISEAIRLAKKFSCKDAGRFVNGILDQLYKNKSETVYTDAI
ncbi:MAG: Transcription antitermination protein NusB [Chlamydiae bacterium]|nr:Transcription antitermination protein NusB [Chlamydiota bacterium]